ncbi:MAG: hypothetical protein WCG47_21380 [Dermatophilaceae bacterium]
MIGAASLAKAGGSGHRPIAGLLDVPASTVRDWLRRIVSVADRVLVVLAAAAAQFAAEFTVPAPVADPVAVVVEMLEVLSVAMAPRLGGSCSPWRLAAVLTGGRLLAPAGPVWGRSGLGVATGARSGRRTRNRLGCPRSARTGWAARVRGGQRE